MAYELYAVILKRFIFSLNPSDHIVRWVFCLLEKIENKADLINIAYLLTLIPFDIGGGFLQFVICGVKFCEKVLRGKI